MRLSALFRSSVPIFTILSLCCFFCEIFQVKALSNVMNRRSALINSCASCIPFILPMSVNAAETIGKDPNCNGPSCLGVWDGLLADCPHGNLGGSACVSSQDDTPGIFAEPWDYSDLDDISWENQMKVLVPALQLVMSKRGDRADIDLCEGRYLRSYITDGKSGEVSVAEFYFTEADTTVQFRIGVEKLSSTIPYFDKKNMERAEAIRKYLKYTKLPVLRNRQRKLLFGESEFDTFGPGSASLGPPAEMTTGELEGRQSSNIDITSALMNGR